MNGQDDEIRLAIGVIGAPGEYQYDFGPPIWSYRPLASDLDKVLSISGGWTGPDCASQTGRPGDTVVDARSRGAAFLFRAALDFSGGADTTLRGQVTVRNLSIVNANANRNGSSGRADASAIQYLGIVQGAGLLVERVIVVNNRVAGDSDSIISVRVHGTGTFKLIGNVITDGQLDAAAGATAMLLDCQGGALCYANNNSIHDNRTFSPHLPFGMALGGIVMAANNVVADNVSYDYGSAVQAGPLGSAAGLDLRNNHFQTDSFVNPGYRVANTSGPADWTRVGDLRIPDHTSLLRNSGRNTPFGGVGSLDVAGNPRIREGTVDRGAYETVNVPPMIIAPAKQVVAATLGIGAIA